MFAHLVQRRQRADEKSIAAALDPVETVEPADVDDLARVRDAEPEPVQQLRPARDRHDRGTVGTEGVIDLARQRVVEIPHDVRPLPATSSTAAVICGYAAQRQMLPLIHSRTSSSDPA